MEYYTNLTVTIFEGFSDTEAEILAYLLENATGEGVIQSYDAASREFVANVDFGTYMAFKILANSNIITLNDD